MHRTGNLIEGCLWIAIGAAMLVSMLRPGTRGAKGVAGLNFIVFGLSDFVEMRTGAWWRPWWLFAWKAACVAVMAIQLSGHLRRTRRPEAPVEKRPDGG